MARALDLYDRWSFRGIPLAIRTASAKIGIRIHEHVYPHAPGAAIEKMGRKLYRFHVSGMFDENLPQSRYPRSLSNVGMMLKLCEKEQTGPLVIPWIGTVQTVVEEFEVTEVSENRSGLKFDAVFVEDLNNEFAIMKFIRVDRKQLRTGHEAFTSAGYKADIFSQIAAVVSFIFSIKDQFELYSALIRSKLDYLENLFREADATATELWNDVVKLRIFQEMWDAVREFGNDLAAKGLTFEYYTVPQVMSIQEVAVAIYQDASKSGDLLGLNPIENVFEIPAGTSIRYYAEA